MNRYELIKSINDKNDPFKNSRIPFSDIVIFKNSSLILLKGVCSKSKQQFITQRQVLFWKAEVFIRMVFCVPKKRIKTIFLPDLTQTIDRPENTIRGHP